MSVSDWSVQGGTAGLLAHARSYGEDRSHERERMERGWRAQGGMAGLLAHARSYGFTSLPHSLL
jgi:hypothetical protein